jgi:hypothetical protein
METAQLTQDLIERWGAETQIEMIIESTLKLGLALQKFKQIDKEEGYSEYTESYNEVCERIAEMDLMIEQAEYIFNKNDIDKHHDIMIQHLKDKLNEY